MPSFRSSSSLSRRILAWMLFLVFSFSALMGVTLYRMYTVREHLELINTTYLRLALILGELHTTQGNLVNTLGTHKHGVTEPEFWMRQVRLAIEYRERSLQSALRIVEQTRELRLNETDRAFLDDSWRMLKAIAASFKTNATAFDRTISTTESRPSTSMQGAQTELLHDERKISRQLRELRNALRGQVKSASVQVAQDQRHSLLAGLLFIGLALCIGLVIAYRVQRMLRPLKTLVEGAKRIGEGDYENRVRIVAKDEIGSLAHEFNQMAQAIEEREKRLLQSERLAAAGTLASHITHEVRNPLNSLSLNTEMLMDGIRRAQGGASSAPGDLEEAQALCQAIHKEVDRLTEITEEYLRFARLPEPQLRRENLNESIRNLVAFCSQELQAHHIHVQLRFASPTLTILCDENQLRQALLNLIRNAREAMVARDRRTLEIATDRRENSAVITVRDSGEGIGSDTLKQIFNPFFSTKRGGTGLGLAITQRIVQEHHGTISVESTLGEGTTFVIEIPLERGS